MFAELTITDGSTFVLDLLGANKKSGGIALASYVPGRVNLRSGGIWQDSPMATGRRIVGGVRANVIDQLELKIAFSSQNAIIQMQQTLDSVIDAVDDYWLTSWTSSPIYLVAQAPGELHKRYAVIYHITLDNYPDPYHEPFAGRGTKFVMDGLIVAIERIPPWMDNPPQSSDAVTLTVADTFDGGSYTAASAIVGSRWGDSIGYVKRYNGAAYAGNPLDNPFSASYTIFHTSPAAGHITYFGGTKPFGTLVFDIGTAMAASSWTIVWEYYNGSTWTALTVTDGSGFFAVSDDTNKFQNTGVRTVRWSQPHDWATVAVDSVTLYWVRARISALTGTPTNPTQQNRHVYANPRPYMEIASSQIEGDLDALAKISLLLRATSGANTMRCNQAFLGLRSTSRGANFRAYLNVKTADNVSGVAVTLTSDTAIHATLPTYSTDARGTTGFLISSTMTDTESIGEIFRITFDETVIDDYRGRYRLLVRTAGTSAYLRYGLKTGATLATTYMVGERKAVNGDALSANTVVRFQNNRPGPNSVATKRTITP